MKVKVILAFGNHRKGDILNPDDPIAKIWIARGFVKKEEEIKAPVNRAILSIPSKRRATR